MQASIDLGHGTERVYCWDRSQTVEVAVWVRDDGSRALITPRRLEAFAMALTYGRKEAAHRLGIASGTLRNHLHRLFGDLGVETAREAALALGWLRLPDHMSPIGLDPARGRVAVPKGEGGSALALPRLVEP